MNLQVGMGMVLATVDDRVNEDYSITTAIAKSMFVVAGVRRVRCSRSRW